MVSVIELTITVKTFKYQYTFRLILSGRGKIALIYR